MSTDWGPIVSDVTNSLVTMVGLVNMGYYRIHKKYKADRYKTWKDFIDANLVEFTHAAVLVPQWGLWIASTATKIIG